jgi:subtilisin family serine protease
MTDSDDVQPSRGMFSWIRRIFRPHRAERPPIVRQERDLSRETVRVQIEVIRRAFDGQVAVASKGDDADAEFLYRPEHVLVRRTERDELDNFFRERQDEYLGAGEVVDDRVEGLNVYRLPPRRSDGGVEVLRTLAELEGAGRAELATPDHILYVTTLGRACPATEPELPPRGAGPVPAQSKDQSAGKGVRVSVVDTGWYAAAATDSDTPWLATGVEGDLEQVNPAAIHEYAGHGTFVAGVVRCLAPAAEIEIEGFLTKGGAIYESQIAAELNEAMKDRDNPHLISISAGTHTYNGQPLMSFQMLAAVYDMIEGDDAPLVIAAAGNDGNDTEFWPAAFDWVVSVGSLDANGKLSDFSNYGKWVDVYAHGRDLVNAFPTGTYTTYEPQTPAGLVREFTTGLAQWSGTSFSTPIVTGAIAAYMSEHGVSARAARDALFAAAPSQPDPTAGTVTMVGPPFV